ncbi:MAG: glycosyl hydrolase family 8, partial [Chloroflexota bacterium]
GTVLLIVVLLLSGLQTEPAHAHYAQPINYSVRVANDAWQDWKDNYVTYWRAGPNPRLRVLGGVDRYTTVSEGQAYGILLASLFDDQRVLDGLWLFTADHLSENGLMHWHIHRHGEVFGTGAATDADIDMAIGMITACEKVRDGIWSASTNGLDYCDIATNLITALYNHTVDHPGVGPFAGLDDNPGYELIPGDRWNLKGEYPDGIVNLSYFSPGYFRVFAAFTGDERWYSVIERNYAIADLSQAIPGNCSGLVPNWSTYTGEPQVVPWQPAQYEWWSYDAVRYAWRIAVDKHWFDSAEASESMNEIGGFFASVGIDEVRAEYRLDGTAINTYTNSLFVSAAAVSIWAADNPTPSDCGDATGSLQSNAQEAYDALAAYDTNDYFNDSWRLLTLALMTDRFPNPLADPPVLDVNGDGIVTPSDAKRVVESMGQTPTGDLLRADVNSNGIIDGRDVNLVIAAIGTTVQTP